MSSGPQFLRNLKQDFFLNFNVGIYDLFSYYIVCGVFLVQSAVKQNTLTHTLVSVKSLNQILINEQTKHLLYQNISCFILDFHSNY